MTINKRSKNSRQRGSKTHGWGAMKKHRGAGHRGGRGAAGSGKRGDAKKPSIWRNTKYAGKRGFSSKTTTINVPITIKHLEEHTKTLIEKGIVSHKAGNYTANLTAAGYTKLLATGNATKKWHIIVENATTCATEKITKAGGKIALDADSKDSKNEKSASNDKKKDDDKKSTDAKA